MRIWRTCINRKISPGYIAAGHAIYVFDCATSNYNTILKTDDAGTS